jgi:hypothetical protein
MELDIETERKETRPANCAYLVRRLQPDLWTLTDLGWLLSRNSPKRTVVISHTRRKKQELYDWVVNNYP